MKQAQLCLDALEYCGKVDPVALRFHLRLSSLHHSLSKFSPQGSDSMRRTEEWVSIPPDFPPLGPRVAMEDAMIEHPSPEYLLRIPARANPEMRQLACALLYALCRPWGESTEPEPEPDSQQQQQQAVENASRHTSNSPSVESLEAMQWHANEDRNFSWDTEGLGIGDINARFMDSEEPSGWLPTADMEVIVEEA